MPVNDDVDIVFDGSLHHVVELGFLAFLVSQIGVCGNNRIVAIGLAVAAIAVVALDAHRKAENVDAELFGSPANHGRVVILRARGIGPKQAHAAEHHLLATGLAYNFAVLDPQRSIYRNRA